MKVNAGQLKYHDDIEQGTPEWIQRRCGVLTSSNIKLIMTPATKKAANNPKSRAYMYELLAQRINGYVAEHYQSDDMVRGSASEWHARAAYSRHYEPAVEMGFITRAYEVGAQKFTLGYSPDGLVGEYGCIEIKAPREKVQVKTIIDDQVPDEHMLQIQTALLVTGRRWCDYVSYCGGMELYMRKVYPIADMHKAIIEIATVFERALQNNLKKYQQNSQQLHPTERIDTYEHDYLDGIGDNPR